MFQRAIKEINAEFIAEERYLDSIRKVVKESCSTAGMSTKDISAVLLAIEEGATNIIRHAYLYEKGTLRLRIVIYRKLLAFSLFDTGRSFEPQGNGKLDLERLVESGRKGGLGFYMIQKIMDSVEYLSSPEFNELRMIKRISRAASEAGPLLRRMSTLRMKFSVWTFFIVALIVGTAFYYINSRSTLEVRRHLDDTVTALANTIAGQASGYIINRRSDVEFDELLVSYVRANPMLSQIVLIDSAGLIIAHSDDIRNIHKPYRPPETIQLDLVGGPQRFERNQSPLSYLILPILSGEKRIGQVHVTYSSAQIQELLVSTRRAILFLTGALLLIGIAGIYLLSNYFVTPILKITERVRRYSAGDTETDLPLEGADEFFEISRALNDMTTRLSRDRRNVIERERMAKEIEVASQIQRTLLPRELPRIRGLDVEGFYRAASLVGGDLYDVFRLSEDRYCLVVADVSGKGVPASLVMSMLRTVLQIYADKAASARQTLLLANEYLVKNMPPGMFITVLLAIYDARDRKLSIVSAGHNPMLYYDAGSNRLSSVNPPGMPLGVDATLERDFASGLQEMTLKLGAGDMFFMYTDGITEAVGRDRQQYGMERLNRFLSSKCQGGQTESLAEMVQSLADEIDSFSGYARQADDITFILCRVRSGDGTTLGGTASHHLRTTSLRDETGST